MPYSLDVSTVPGLGSNGQHEKLPLHDPCNLRPIKRIVEFSGGPPENEVNPSN